MRARHELKVVPHYATVLHGSRQCFHILIILLLKPPVLANLSCKLGTCNRQVSFGVVNAILHVIRVGDIYCLCQRRVWHLFKVVDGDRLFLILVKHVLLQARMPYRSHVNTLRHDIFLGPGQRYQDFLESRRLIVRRRSSG